MKILYGVQGTGNGHISRARVMSKALKQQNIDVDFYSLVAHPNIISICNALAIIRLEVV